ncbi:hypothetical protein [Desulfonatronovibrio hydrogenovorans]|uniref:hypothetical protein n=1 Tax=Desulfonatronovibrio hydrogenovorans TaxID=53245 RepID=UPI0004902A4F|nr:hypothetical protein [Desulfonatronovibrio hydrogenovorans]
MGQVKIDAQSKSISIPQWLFFSKKIPLTQIREKTERIESSGGGKVFRMTLSGDFGSQEISFDNYESYATFIYEYQKAMLGA